MTVDTTTGIAICQKYATPARMVSSEVEEDGGVRDLLPSRTCGNRSKFMPARGVSIGGRIEEMRRTKVARKESEPASSVSFDSSSCRREVHEREEDDREYRKSLHVVVARVRKVVEAVALCSRVSLIRRKH